VCLCSTRSIHGAARATKVLLDTSPQQDESIAVDATGQDVYRGLGLTKGKVPCSERRRRESCQQQRECEWRPKRMGGGNCVEKK
jgi:hypothetical protein